MAVVALALLAVAVPAQAQFRSSPPPPPMRPPPPPPMRVAPPPPSNKVGPSAGADKGALRGSAGAKPGVSPMKPATAAKPSTGPKAQPAPLKRLVPPPPRVPTGAGTNTGSFLARSPQTARTVLGQGGRNWQTDGRVIQRNPRLGDPYYHGRGATDGVTNVYYGDTSSSAFYLFAGAMLFNPPQDRPLPPQATDEVSQGIASLLGVIESERKIMAERAKAKAKAP